MALRTKGETADELEGLARTMLEFANPVDPPGAVVDTCGTGGDRSGTFNISTVAAIVVAGAGVPVAKHGNRAASSHCGSADLLEALGVKIDLDAAGVERCLAEAGIGFMFAPVFHPAAGHAGSGPRRAPRADRLQLPGAAHEPRSPVRAGRRRLRRTHAAAHGRGPGAPRRAREAVPGEDGLDELTTNGLSTVLDVRDGEVREGHLDPQELGLARASADDLRGGDAAESAAIARAILAGEAGPHATSCC